MNIFGKKARNTGLAIVAAFSLTFGMASPAFAALEGVDTAVGIDEGRNCIYNGFKYIPPEDGIAESHHCYTTPDNSTVPRLAEVDASKTLEDLKATRNYQVLHPDHYMAQGSYATSDIQQAPVAANSQQIAEAVANPIPMKFLPDNFDPWLRAGANIGGGVASHDNIPIYVVDSSNPHEEFAEFTSTDGRVVNFGKLTEITTGRIPLPSYAKTSDGGDKALAIYDMGTGIWRSYFHAVKQEDGTWVFSSAGYQYFDPETHNVGEDNYWLGHIQGGSSVVGMSNELTQIGMEEFKRGEINHAISLTFPDYRAGSISFPAKQTDGRLTVEEFPDAPSAGQRFRIPADFDIEAYAAEKNLNQGVKTIMYALQKYGGIVSDRNVWSMAFNFENPYGMGIRMEDPELNGWKEDEEALALANGMNLNRLPWDQMEWIQLNWAGDALQEQTPPEPVDPTEDPIDPTEDPIDPTEDPVDPVDPTEDPVDPVDPTEDPVDPTDPTKQAQFNDDVIENVSGESQTFSVLDNDNPSEGSEFDLDSLMLLDVDGNPVKELIIENKGTLTKESDGNITFVAAEDFVGELPEITYQVTDTNGNIGTGKIIINVIEATVDPTEDPVDPVDPTEEPVDPVDPIEEPVDPVGPTEEPIDPVDPTEDPIEPVDPTEDPIDPVDPTEEPVDPVDPTEDPIDPVDPTEDPVDPINPTEDPVNPTEKPTNSTKTPVNDKTPKDNKTDNSFESPDEKFVTDLDKGIYVGDNPPAGFTIKGEINNGERIYHTPGSKSYNAITPDVWFNSAETAKANGFREAYKTIDINDDNKSNNNSNALGITDNNQKSSSSNSTSRIEVKSGRAKDEINLNVIALGTAITFAGLAGAVFALRRKETVNKA